MRTTLIGCLTAALLTTSSTPALANRELSLEWLRNQAGRFDGPAAGDLAGRALAGVGDVNGDGHDDFAVGAYDTGFLDPAGRVYLVYGTAHGLPLTATLGADVVLTGNQSGDSTGTSVAGAGDVNGDGFDDLLIGAPRWDKGVEFDAGRAYLVYGGPSLPASIALASLGSGEGVRLEGGLSGQLAGESVAGPGDVNGDGRPDLLIGAPGTDAAAGAAYLVHGGTSLPDVIDLTSLGSAGLTIHGAAAGDQAGRPVAAAGDVDDDGFRDLLLSSSQADPPGKVNGGRVSLIYGGPSLPTSLDLASLGSAGVQILGEGPGDFIGKALSGGGDVDGDGHDDLLIGSPDYDVGAGSNHGRAWLVYGGDSLSATIDLATLGAGGVVLAGAAAGDNAGNAVALGGDTNRDGYADLAVAAHNADPGGNSSGAVYLIHGGPALPGTVDLGALGTGGEQFSGFQAGVRVGDVAAFLGDVDDDGFDDLGLASRFADDGGIDAGAAWVIKGGCHWLVAEGAIVEGGSFTLRALGTPDDQWLNFVAPAVFATPFETAKGPFWLADPFLSLGVLSFDAQGEASLPISIPTGLGLSGLSAYWQFMQTPQGFGCDLSRLLITTVE